MADTDPITQALPTPPPPAAPRPPGKSFLVTILLSVFVGHFGIDRFYLGYIPTGILKLITFGGLGIWWLIDLIRIAMQSLGPADGSSYSQ